MNISELVKIEWKEIKRDTIINYPEIKDLCYRSYPNHKKGCPNVQLCNSQDIPPFKDILFYGNYSHFYLIYAKFNFRIYKELRKEENPTWSDNQIKCVLYWQNSVKKMLIDYINSLNLNDMDHYILGCGSGMRLNLQRVGSMENSCINVFSTMKLNGIKMEIKPRNTVYLVCLLCSKKEINFIKKTNSVKGLLKFIERA